LPVGQVGKTSTGSRHRLLAKSLRSRDKIALGLSSPSGEIMVRRLVFALVALFAVPAHAQNVKRIDIEGYGIYTTEKEAKARNANGVLENDMTSVGHGVTTTTIPAEHGVYFGIRYRVIGSPKGKIVQLRKVTIYPPEGVKSPQSPTPLQSNERLITPAIGDLSDTGYIFDDPWELVPGKWKFQLWLGDRLLAEKEFTVVAK
jgi:hypothetical protein